MKTLLSAALATAMLVSPALALEPLSQNKVVNDKLIAARVADRIRRECKTIDGRLIYAWSQARSLKKYAEDQGYSDAQIDAFLDSKTDKDRIYAAAEVYLTSHGVKAGDSASFCTLGQAEIAAKSFIGSFLKAR